MSDLTVRRETQPQHQCLCIMVWVEDGEVRHDRCGYPTSPDQPVCDFCEARGHSTHPDAMPITEAIEFDKQQKEAAS